MQNKTKILKNANWQFVFRLIKWVVPFFIALIVYKKFYRNNGPSFEELSRHFFSLQVSILVLIPVFAVLNWVIEIKKWQFLVKKVEFQNFRIAAKSVLSGVAVSQLLPYRTGEYLGRLAFVSDRNKITAGILSVAGSFSQLIITLIFGIAAFVYIHPIDYPLSFIISFLLLLILLILGYFYMPQFSGLKRLEFFVTVQHALKLLSRKDMLILLLFSMVRYFTFVIPYAVLAHHFELGIDSSLIYLITAVACIYFLQTVSPNFILTDLAIRLSVSALVFSGSFIEFNGRDHIPGLIIYVFNVLVPMCMGAFVLLLIKLRK